MKLCFINPISLVYSPLTPEQHPLAGAESALCYLMRALTYKGHQVSLIQDCQAPYSEAGIDCYPLAFKRDMDFWRHHDFEAIIGLHEPEVLAPVYQPPSASPRRFFWSHHNTYDARLTPLKYAEELPYEVVCVSQWQRQTYLNAFGLAPGRCHLIPNGLAPAFENLFTHNADLVRAKQAPLTLAYTAMPERGLFILLAVFPALKRLFPTLSLQIYAAPDTLWNIPELAPFYPEYKARADVQIKGRLSQPQLAQALYSTHILAYPATCSETFCISALEAQAAACRVVSTRIGALEETLKGCGRLLSPQPLKQFAPAYFEALRQELEIWYHLPFLRLKALWQEQQSLFGKATWDYLTTRWERLLQTHSGV